MPATGEAPVGVIVIGIGPDGRELRSQIGRSSQRWRTRGQPGTNPEVNSVYLRLVEVHPETEGHVANTADGGALALTLARQAGMALEQVPTPELVIIQTIDNDLGCPLDDVNSLRAIRGLRSPRALEQIVEASPLSRT